MLVPTSRRAKTQQQILVVTGMSGAGRSTVADALEDLGWYVVDNLPPQMLQPLMGVAKKAGDALPKIAAVVDVRGRGFFELLNETVESLRATRDVRVLFLDASDTSLVRRFESVRRPHPLQADGTLIDGISTERNRLQATREAADIVIDTSDLNPHQLSLRVNELFAEADRAQTEVTITSFGFKYGLPTDADVIIDARFIPNPHWREDLRTQTGLDDAVFEYVMQQEGVEEFVSRFVAALEPVIAGYRRENKRHVLIGVGCTGGKHRSVSVARELQKRLAEQPGVSVTTKHRDLGRE